MEFTEYDTRLAGYAVIVDAQDRILLSWYNGRGTGSPGWTLPGGGVEYEETVEAAVEREVWEETGYQVEVGRLLAVDTFTQAGLARPRPFKSVRVIYLARILSGTLGTLEVGGTTDRAAWMPVADALQTEARAGIIDVAISARAAIVG